ncbi:MAG: Asp-tRNA(Asn)/Glu-tRNA(Gln) amidotransferase subunit GatA [Planctomycetota bacterium]|nr:Asp-tRNA(Asn)/Glu-tRNA(Gln) amidotransferase subunit GatA [Planctomycetota bacterium]
METDTDRDSELPWTSARALRDKIQNKESSAEDLCRAFLHHAQSKDKDIGAFLELNETHILDQARAVDAKLARGQELGALAGVPVAIKDNLCVSGEITSAGSKILSDFRPPYDAHVIEKLRAADAILFGKVNLDEFAMGSSTENSGRHITKNPWNLDYVPGGSSGGSAAAVAAGFAPLALGSDTGGSIRQPASLCGVMGLKPSYGRVSRYGLLAFASSLDQVGPFARNVEDLALLLEVISGHDARDMSSANTAVPNYLQNLNGDLSGLTLGLPKEYFEATLDPEVLALTKAAIAKLESLGATTIDISLALNKYAIACYQIISTAEASSNLARYDGVHYGHRSDKVDDLLSLYSRSRTEGFGPEVQRRIMLGTFVLSTGSYDAYYLKAQKTRQLIRLEYDKAFRHCDVMVSPTSPFAAIKIGEKVDDPLTMYASDALTVSANLVGVPGLVIPCGFSKEKLPVGLQILGPHWSEQTLLNVAHAYQSVTDHHTKHPE